MLGLKAGERERERERENYLDQLFMCIFPLSWQYHIIPVDPGQWIAVCNLPDSRLAGTWKSHLSGLWRVMVWKNGLPDLNPSGRLLLDFCAGPGSPITMDLRSYDHSHDGSFEPSLISLERFPKLLLT